jgi:hypothetical protein
LNFRFEFASSDQHKKRLKNPVLFSKIKTIRQKLSQEQTTFTFDVHFVVESADEEEKVVKRTKCC